MLIVSCPSYPCHFASLHLTSTAPQPHHIPHLTWTSHPSLHRFAPQSLDSPGFQSIATLIIILLSKKNYTRNPYLIAKLVEVETQCIFLPFIPYVPFFHLASYLSRFTSPSLLFQTLHLTLPSMPSPFIPPPIPNPSPHPSPRLLFPTLHLTSPFTPPSIPNPSPHLTLHALTLHPTSHPALFSTHHSLTPHNPSASHPVSSSTLPTLLTCPLPCLHRSFLS